MTATLTASAADYTPGAVFHGRFMTSTLLELSDAMFRSEVEARRGAGGGPLHRHLHQQERFAVHDGALRVWTGLRGSRLVRAGEEIVVPPGRPHTFRVAGERARFTAEFTPPLRVADYFLELFALERPGLRDIARLAGRYPREHFYLPVVPARVERAVLAMIARGG
ncbi:MAG TPA: cupin domain-containing protein [Solirubrobacteraceae bacterium]|nr:cupin domain-containing protein [Solirubrobacteraceae bacterium]